MSKIKDLKKKFKEAKGLNKGFTLVELIVVIVILAILIGVTIGGIYRYVSQSRDNTDANNASSLQSVLSTMCAEQNVYSWAKGNKTAAIKYTWKDAVKADTIASADDVKNNIEKADETGVKARIVDLCPDGLPASKKGTYFTFELQANNGNPKIIVKSTDKTEAPTSDGYTELTSTTASAGGTGSGD